MVSENLPRAKGIIITLNGGTGQPIKNQYSSCHHLWEVLISEESLLRR
jgi:hypothetical protein